MTENVLDFGRFRLDLVRPQLYRDGKPVPLRRRALEILCVLASAEGAFVSKEELIARVWPNRVVEENNLYVHIASVRKALDAGSSDQSWIVTATGRGYRFAYPEKASIAAPVNGSLAGPVSGEKARIAVLPFRVIPSGTEDDEFAAGLAEEIITALSRISWLSVISPSLCVAYRGHTIDLARVGRELGVRYAVEGAVRKTSGRLRVTYRLVETETGSCLASDRFNGTLADILELQEKVAVGLTGAIEPTLQAVCAERSLDRSVDELTAHDLYLRGYAMALSAGVRFREALPLLETAIAQDPGYAPALAWASVGCVRMVMDGRSNNPQSDRQKGTDYAWRALELGSDDPRVISNCALTLGYVGEDIGAVTALSNRALALNPAHARSWHISGMLRFYAGDLDTAIDHVETSLRLSPRLRVGWGNTWIGAAHFLSGRFEEAVPKLFIAIQEDPSFPDPYRFLSACYAHMNRRDKAQEIVERLRTITPAPMPDTMHLRSDEQRDMLLTGLHLAGAEQQAL